MSTGQLDLFGESTSKRAEGLDLMRALRFDEARIVFGRVADDHERVTRLAIRLEAVPKSKGRLGAVDQALGWLDDPDLGAVPGLDRVLRGELARRLERALGEGARHGSLLAGALFLEAEEPSEAARSLTARTTTDATDGEAWTLLGAAHFGLGQRDAARSAWLAGFAQAPLSMDLAHIADPNVTRIIDEARDSCETDDGDPRLWVAPLGLLRGVFSVLDLPRDLPPPPLGTLGTPRERAMAALHLLAQERSSRDPVPARRGLKQLSEWLLDALLKR